MWAPPKEKTSTLMRLRLLEAVAGGSTIAHCMELDGELAAAKRYEGH
jgi:hypothetical protein